MEIAFVLGFDIINFEINLNLSNHDQKVKTKVSIS